MPRSAPVVIGVVGPTATGKSDLALQLAERLGGEIVNADASQLYRGMDVGTAKVPVDERRDILHHQLDVLDLTQESSVAAYQRAARRDLAAIGERGRRAVVVGGSGLYVRALLDRLEIPPTDPDVRERWELALAEQGSLALHARLQAEDPVAAGRIDPRNGRRLVRALEVIELIGTPFSASMPTREYAEPTVTIGLMADSAEVDRRIETRVRQMWDSGLLQEVAALSQRGLREGRTARRAVGYEQVLAHLDGELTSDAAQRSTIVATHRLARRQRSWFGADPRVRWLPHDATDLTEQALAAVASEER